MSTCLSTLRRRRFAGSLAGLLFIVAGQLLGQSQPVGLAEDPALTRSLERIVADLGLMGDFDCGDDGMEQISPAVVDLSSDRPVLGGVHADNFIYPASVYKMYVAAEVLRQCGAGRYSLTTPLVVRSPNDVDRSREIPWDPRPLLRDGDTVTVGYLLDLMLTRSDNSAANCLIDLARRDSINAFMHRNGWQGSEVTRKFLRRAFEDPGYEKVRGTETNARHAAEFLVKVQSGSLESAWVSAHLRSSLTRQLDTTKLSTGLPPTAVFSHKTGWFSTWTHDVGIVEDGPMTNVIACFLPIAEAEALPIMKRLAVRIHALMRARSDR